MQAKNPHFCADFLFPIPFFWSKSEQNKDIQKILSVILKLRKKDANQPIKCGFRRLIPLNSYGRDSNPSEVKTVSIPSATLASQLTKGGLFIILHKKDNGGD